MHSILVAATVALWILSISLDTRAGDAPRVFLIQPTQSSALVDEALIRTHAELSALGFQVSRSAQEQFDDNPEALDFGSLELVPVSATTVQIHAWSPDRLYDHAQVVDLSETGVDAEVLTIRAVEALRATMTQYARDARRGEEPLPAPVQQFARLAESEPGREEGSPLDSTPVVPPTVPPLRPFLSVGPVATLPSHRMRVGWAGRFGAFLRAEWAEGGVAVETTLAPNVASANGGQLEVERDLAAAHVALHQDLSSALSWNLKAGGGLARYTVKGLASDGFVGTVDQLVTGLLQISVGVESWFHPNLAWYLDVQVNIAGNAPEPQINGQSVAIIGQPGFGISLGMVTGQGR